MTQTDWPNGMGFDIHLPTGTLECWQLPDGLGVRFFPRTEPDYASWAGGKGPSVGAALQNMSKVGP